MSLQVRGTETEALLTDRYLDALLAAHDRRAADSPSDADLDPAIRLAASRLAADLDRVHPSFRFEERLAARLAEVAARMRMGIAAGGEGSRPLSVQPLALVTRHGAFGPQAELDAMLARASGLDFDPAADGAMDGPESDPGRFTRPLIIGGALTSAALSIAGAAIVAWRRTRPPLSPMARAVRAAGQARLGRDAGAVSTPRALD